MDAFARSFGIAALTGIVVLVPNGAFSAQPVGITGRGTTQAGGYEVRVNAVKTDSQVRGTWQTRDYRGTVDQLVPPSGDRDFFCVSGPITGRAERLNLYIRDSGDGKTTFDQWQVAAGSAASCETFPSPGPWITLDAGDFKAIPPN